MTNEEKQITAKTYGQLASMYGRQISAETIIMIVNALNDLPFSEINTTLTTWCETETQFPLPALVRKKIKPDIDANDNISEAVNRSISAVSKFGYCNSNQAKNYIGELGWQIIQGMGGWVHLCEILGSETPEGVMRKQMLDYGETVWKRSKWGELDLAPSLPESIKNILPNLKLIE